MAKAFNILCLVWVLTLITVQAQNRVCQRIAIKARAGQRLCERQCPPSRLPTLCATVRIVQTIRLCPPNCCRIGDGCRTF